MTVRGLKMQCIYVVIMYVHSKVYEAIASLAIHTDEL